VPTVMSISANNNAMETDQSPNNKKYYNDTNSMYVARENTEITSFVKDSISELALLLIFCFHLNGITILFLY